MLPSDLLKEELGLMAKRYFPQERQRTCMVASLRTVLANQFGVHIREDVLRFAGDQAEAPIVEDGTDSTSLRWMVQVADRARNTGPRWRLRAHRYGSIADLARELRAGRYPIVAVGLPEGERHAIVVTKYRPGKVRYFDPATGVEKWCGSGEFRRWWLDAETGGWTWYAVVSGGKLGGD